VCRVGSTAWAHERSMSRVIEKGLPRSNR
jgi:hypothetical protein